MTNLEAGNSSTTKFATKMLEDPSLCSLEKTLLFTSVVDFFQGGFRVIGGISLMTLRYSGAKEKLPAPLETVVKLTLPGQAGG